MTTNRGTVKVMMVGIGGYGNQYVAPMLDATDAPPFELVAGIAPHPERCTRLADLKARGVAVHTSMEDFYAAGGQADLAIISSPMHLHTPHTCLALEHGSHVLCEKPLCNVLTEIPVMVAARNRARREVGVAYQWSFSRSIQRLKKDIMEGVFGQPIRMKSLVVWPRNEAYYQRNRWAGAVRNDRGELVLDSPVNNACAHFLHNMLYLLGDRMDRSARPVRVTAELYRGYAIPNYDTGVLRVRTDRDVEILFFASHLGTADVGPMTHAEFEYATLTYEGWPLGDFVATFRNGEVRNYGSPQADSQFKKLWDMIEVARGEADVPCGIEAAAAHTRCMLGAQESCEVTAFAPGDVRAQGPAESRQFWVPGLVEAMKEGYAADRLPSELGAPWARRGRDVAV